MCTLSKAEECIRFGLRLWALCVLGCWLGACANGNEPCRSQANCEGDNVCAQGECLLVFCELDGDCPSTFVCDGGVCRRSTIADAPPCQSQDECEQGFLCRQGRCLEEGLCGAGELACSPGEPDEDGDGVADGIDNCPDELNNEQADTDSDGQGDVCDADDDGDALVDEGDNCPLDANLDQTDTDSDGQGDVCDEDDDGDGVDDDEDNCPLVANEEQADEDDDGVGDACDEDSDEGGDDDGDGVLDGQDNCPEVDNPDQEDSDRDGRGDACDPQPQVRNFRHSGRLVQFKGQSSSNQHKHQGTSAVGVRGRSSGQRFKVRGHLR